MKTCACGATYTTATWRQLERVGIMDVESEFAEDPSLEPVAGDERVPPIELRNCARCRSTMALTVPYAGGSVYPPSTVRMRYCRECKENGQRENCEACAEERGRIVAGLAREIFVRSISRRAARSLLSTSYHDHALEAFVASDDFLGIAESWADEGRAKMIAKRVPPATIPKKDVPTKK